MMIAPRMRGDPDRPLYQTFILAAVVVVPLIFLSNYLDGIQTSTEQNVVLPSCGLEPISEKFISNFPHNCKATVTKYGFPITKRADYALTEVPKNNVVQVGQGGTDKSNNPRFSASNGFVVTVAAGVLYLVVRALYRRIRT